MNNFKIRYGNEYIEFSTQGQIETHFAEQDHSTSGNYYGYMISDDEVGNPNAEITVQFLIEDCHKSGMSFEALRVKLGAFKRFSDKVN